MIPEHIPADSSGAGSAVSVSLRYPLRSSSDEGISRYVREAVTAISVRLARHRAGRRTSLVAGEQ